MIPDNATIYRHLYRIRRVEEDVARVYPTDCIKSPVHLSIGQEAVAVGACLPLGPEDAVFITYRSHAAYLAKGGNLRAMIAELYGKDAGCARGRGGSMHLIDNQAHVMGASAVVGTTLPNSLGYALGLMMQGRPGVVVSFCGDGATDEGVFWESINFAALKKLRMILVCENNGLAIHTRLMQRQGRTDIASRVAAFGIPAKRIPGNDTAAILAEVTGAVEALRDGADGPYFIECETCRWKEHVGPGDDFQMGYRTRDEVQPWIDRDEVRKYAELVGAPERGVIEAEVEAEIKDAFEFAASAPFPRPDQLMEHCLAPREAA
mgnify:CR=1 FL=1